jgi:hypothetical protein
VVWPNDRGKRCYWNPVRTGALETPLPPEGAIILRAARELARE